MNSVSKLNVANVFTFARLPLCFLGIWIFGRSPLWGVLVIVLAAMTDFFDGVVARRFNCVTEFGRRLDPTVDKLFMLVVLIFALVKTGVGAGAVILLAIVAIELLIAVTSLVTWRRSGRTPVVVKLGKYGMFGRMIAVTAVLLSTAVSGTSLEAAMCTALVTGSIGVGLGLIAWTDYAVQAKLGPPDPTLL